MRKDARNRRQQMPAPQWTPAPAVTAVLDRPTLVHALDPESGDRLCFAASGDHADPTDPTATITCPTCAQHLADTKEWDA